MDTLFFWASKLFWMIFTPGSLIMLLVTGAWLSMMAGWQKLSRRLLTSASLLLLLIAFLPLGEWAIAPLERRFNQNPTIASPVDGIVVLGGSVSPGLSAMWDQPQLNGSAERLTSFLDLAIRYPNARLLFSGGSGDLRQQELKEADVADELFYQLGFVNHNIQFEKQSRNTYENGVFSKEMMMPAEGENWLLVTSAFHMPRAMGVFCQQQWPVTAYPVDYRSNRDDLLRFELDVEGSLSLLSTAIHEWLGLLAYRISGKTSNLLPGADNSCMP
ncbi:MAG: YdcF family protein [Gammaproteobacteria bacterium]|nr:YdcF family protein [Gammaproteobacteria bacterium]